MYLSAFDGVIAIPQNLIADSSLSLEGTIMEFITNLVKFDKDGIEILVNTETGESFASVSGYARMSNKDKSTISRRLKGVASELLFSSEIQTPGGLQGVALISEDLICEWLPKDNPVLSKQLMKLGSRLFLHNLAGYEVKSTAVVTPTPQTYLEALKALVASEEEKARLEEEKNLLEVINQDLDIENHRLSEAVDELFNYSSIIRIAKFNNVSEKQFSWHKLKAQSKLMGVEVKSVPCPRFVSKNLYSHDVWRACYPKSKLPETLTITVSHQN